MRDINTSFVLKDGELKEFVDGTNYRINDGYSLEKYLDDINGAIKYLDDEVSQLISSKNFLDWYDIKCDNDKFTEIIQNLTCKKNELFIDRVNFRNLLYIKQKNCKHDEEFVRYIGQDHNHDYHVCDKCGKEFKF